MKYVCDVCGWVYDEEKGYPEGGIAPGTKFEDYPRISSVPCAKSAKICSARNRKKIADSDQLRLLSVFIKLFSFNNDFFKNLFEVIGYTV